MRVDSHAYPSYKVLPNYDSLVAKLIVWGEDREEAIARMDRALDEFVIAGISTTIPFHLEVLKHEAFISGKFGTNFIAKYFNNKKD